MTPTQQRVQAHGQRKRASVAKEQARRKDGKGKQRALAARTKSRRIREAAPTA